MISILLGTGFEETEGVTLYDILKRAGLDVRLVSVGDSLEVCSARKLRVLCDHRIQEVFDMPHEALVIPGGMGGVRSLMASAEARELARKLAGEGCLLAAICAGPMVLDAFGLLEGREYTCYPGVEEEIRSGHYAGGDLVWDEPLLTGTCPGTASLFGMKLAELLTSPSVAKKISMDWHGGDLG